jgi:CxxC-x17-CxxC domain-containing protein
MADTNETQTAENGDKMLTCQSCGESFPFTEQEQRFFHEMGFVTPRYCPACRRKRKKEAARSEPWKDFYDVTCDRCGEETTVPFKPVHGRPVYCRSCLTTVQQQEKRSESTAQEDSRETNSDAAPIAGLGLALHEDAERPYDKLQDNVRHMVTHWIQSGKVD